MEELLIKLNDLPDEILIIILKNLYNFETFYSLIGVNKRFNRIAHNSIFTTHLTLMTFLNDSIYCLPDLILDRFCLQILLEIHYKIKWLNLESISMERILRITNYPNLYGLGLYGIDVENAISLFINIQQTFKDFKNNQIISYVNYFEKRKYGYGHIYSYPYRMKYYDNVTNNFPGGLFKYVARVTLYDDHPFEYEFFVQIS
ncbi:unnamed protein product [Rotaria sp. Silwood2]|nr:unnamed protein product [Rotaria sp. Silwood2]CAF3281868.1 unnamed protein product [Rotaria sp. Silwood2]CAF4472700.1 unnamed protein product [Rotaria sp. Silwood2]